MSNSEEQAVSPVVGVMLMLVVTIIIASVVSAFAGGLWGNTDKAPVVTIQASIVLNDMSNPGNNNITLTDTGGDPFQIKDVKLIVSNDTTSIVFTNTSVTALLRKGIYTIDDTGSSSSGIIRPGDQMVGNVTPNSEFFSGQEYKWTLIHIPSQKTIATGKVYT
ncbi:MAG TPA: type IV pilin N-terminal domain-containing protein [Methanoregulaceae archaeon]|nr:type IV pilin N-terminal domain-containing protein [Methanoregulaceae archaeon]